MASVLDHKHFREEQMVLSQLHDEWMHSSTGYSNPLGEYNFGPMDTVQQRQLGPWDLPPVDKGISLGFSPHDFGAMYQRHTQSSNGLAGVASPDTSGGVTPDSKGKAHHGKDKQQRHKQHGGGGGGGGKALGPGVLGGTPQLGNVPYTTQPAGGGTSPIVAIITIGVIAITIYFIWHKFRQSRSEDKDLSAKGR